MPDPHELASGKVEVRFPDATANPYLAFSAMLMAGLDGIQNKIHPGDAMDKDLYDPPAEELADPNRLRVAREALESLDADRAYLTWATSSPTSRSTPISSLRWKKSLSWSTHRTRSSSKCTTPIRSKLETAKAGGGAYQPAQPK